MSMATSRKKTPVNEPVDALAPEPIIAPEEEEVPVPTQPKPAPVAEKASEKTAGFCVYIGPTIIGVVQRGTVYRGDKPEVLALLKDAVEKYPLIGYPEEDAPFFYGRAKELGIHFNQIMTVDNDYGNLSMVSQNLGFGVYPRMIAENCQFPVKAIPTDLGSSTPISIGIRSYEKGSLAAKAFVDYVLEKYLSE